MWGRREEKRELIEKNSDMMFFSPKYHVYFLKARTISFITRIQLPKSGN